MRIGRWCSGRVGGPNGRYCKVSGQEIFCFSTLPHHPAGRQQSCRTRLSVDKSIEATTPHGPATWLGACVLGVARRFECSELARTAYGACASDGRSADAWTERAPILRGREGVKISLPYKQPRTERTTRARNTNPAGSSEIYGVLAGGEKSTAGAPLDAPRAAPEGGRENTTCADLTCERRRARA